MTYSEVLKGFNMSAKTMEQAIKNCNHMTKNEAILEQAAKDGIFKPSRKNCPPGICVDDWMGLAMPKLWELPG